MWTVLFYCVLPTVSVPSKLTSPFKTMNQNRPFSLYKLSQMFVEVMESYHFTDKERYSKRTCLILQGPESVELEWYKKKEPVHWVWQILWRQIRWHLTPPMKSLSADQRLSSQISLCLREIKLHSQYRHGLGGVMVEGIHTISQNLDKDLPFHLTSH